MFVPADTNVALPMMFMLWFCWGIWPSARMKGGSTTKNFALTYVSFQVLSSWLYCFTLGMMSFPSALNFDERQFHQVIAQEMSEKFGAVLIAMLGGFMLCSGDFMMAKAIEVLGLSVACPLGYGTAMVFGTAVSYAIDTGPKADARLLFPGLGACLLGNICNTMSSVDPGKILAGLQLLWARKTAGSTQSLKASPEPIFHGEDAWDYDFDVHEEFPERQANKDEEKISEPDGLENAQIVSTNFESETSKYKRSLNRRSVAKMDLEEQEGRCLALALTVMAGIFLGSPGPVSTAAHMVGQLTPFSQLFCFMLGQLISIYPLVTTVTWISYCHQGRKGRSLFTVPCAVARGYINACRERRKAVLYDAFAGTCVGTGQFLFLVGSPVVSKAVGFMFGTSSLLLSIIMGVVVFKELRGKSKSQKLLTLVAALCLVLSLSLMCVASVGL